MGDVFWGLIFMVGMGCIVTLMVLGVMVVYHKAMREIQLTKDGARDGNSRRY